MGNYESFRLINTFFFLTVWLWIFYSIKSLPNPKIVLTGFYQCFDFHKKKKNFISTNVSHIWNQTCSSTPQCHECRFSLLSHAGPGPVTSSPSLPTPVLLRPAKPSVCAMESGITDQTQLLVFTVGLLPPRLPPSCQTRHACRPLAKARPFQTPWWWKHNIGWNSEGGGRAHGAAKRDPWVRGRGPAMTIRSWTLQGSSEGNKATLKTHLSNQAFASFNCFYLSVSLYCKAF